MVNHWTSSLNDPSRARPPDLSQRSITNDPSGGNIGSSASFNIMMEPTQASWNCASELLNKFQQKVDLIGDALQEMQVLYRRAIDQIGVYGSEFDPSRSADFTSSLYTTHTTTLALGRDVRRLDMSDDRSAHADIAHIPFTAVSGQKESNKRSYADGLSMASYRTSMEVYTPSGALIQPSSSKNNSNDSPFVCHECGYETKRKGDLKRHREGQCHSEPRYACSCGKSFTRNYTLKKHAKKCWKVSQDTPSAFLVGNANIGSFI